MILGETSVCGHEQWLEIHKRSNDKLALSASLFHVSFWGLLLNKVLQIYQDSVYIIFSTQTQIMSAENTPWNIEPYGNGLSILPMYLMSTPIQRRLHEIIARIRSIRKFLVHNSPSQCLCNRCMHPFCRVYGGIPLTSFFRVTHPSSTFCDFQLFTTATSLAIITYYFEYPPRAFCTITWDFTVIQINILFSGIQKCCSNKSINFYSLCVNSYTHFSLKTYQCT